MQYVICEKVLIIVDYSYVPVCMCLFFIYLLFVDRDSCWIVNI